MMLSTHIRMFRVNRALPLRNKKQKQNNKKPMLPRFDIFSSVSTCLSLPAEDTVMAKPDAGFGQNVGKLQRTIQGKLKDLRYEILMKRAKAELPNDDQRRISLEAADSFSNAFPANLDASIKLENGEFTAGFSANLASP